MPYNALRAFGHTVFFVAHMIVQGILDSVLFSNQISQPCLSLTQPPHLPLSETSSYLHVPANPRQRLRQEESRPHTPSKFCLPLMQLRTKIFYSTHKLHVQLFYWYPGSRSLVRATTLTHRQIDPLGEPAAAPNCVTNITLPVRHSQFFGVSCYVNILCTAVLNMPDPACPRAT